MRIIKDVPNAMCIIAGEAINIEASKRHFINGEKVETVTKGYPIIVDKGVQYAIASAVGYIYLSSNCDIDKFEASFVETICKMSDNLTQSDIKSHLNGYHTVECGYATNIKKQSSAILTRQSNRPTSGSSEAVSRQIIRGVNDPRRARFTWILRPIQTFSYAITSVRGIDAIAAHVCSIFYDVDDVCSLDHDQFVDQFSRDLLRGFPNVAEYNAIRLLRYGNPLLIELSSYWRTRTPSLCNINSSKVYCRDIEGITIEPVVRVGGRIDVCNACTSALWGEIYILAGHMQRVANCLALCAVCAHTKDKIRLLSEYARIFRVHYFRGVDEMIDTMSTSETRQDILREALVSTIFQRTKIGMSYYKYVLLGKKYLGVTTIDDYLCSPLSTSPLLAGRRVCCVKIIK